jgi:20S proteasome alpha/beta subunit
MMRHPKLPVPVSPWPFRPKPRQLPHRKRMTIAVGVLSNDNSLVIASDCQETVQGYWKRTEVKVRASSAKRRGRDTGVRLAIAGAGRAGYADALEQHVSEAFSKAEGNVPKALDAMYVTLREFHQHHVAPYPDLPEVQLLVGVQKTGAKRPWLYSTDRGTMTQISHHAAVGIGSGHALNLLFEHDGVQTSSQAVALAVYAVHHTKNNVADCGNHTSVCVLDDAGSWYVPYPTIARMDEIFEMFMGINEVALTAALIGLRPKSIAREAMSRFWKLHHELADLSAERRPALSLASTY